MKVLETEKKNTMNLKDNVNINHELKLNHVNSSPKISFPVSQTDGWTYSQVRTKPHFYNIRNKPIENEKKLLMMNKSLNNEQWKRSELVTPEKVNKNFHSPSKYEGNVANSWNPTSSPLENLKPI